MTDNDSPDMLIGGWAGTVSESDDGDTDVAQWSTATRASIHPDLKNRCENDGLAIEGYLLGADELEPDMGGPLDIEQPRQITPRSLSPKDQDERIRLIFGLTSNDTLPDVGGESQEACSGHLSTHLAFPLTARAPTEGRSGGEYGHSDRVNVVGLGDPDAPMIDRMYGMLCDAHMEGPVVTLPMGELHDVKGKPNRQLIEDHCDWRDHWCEPGLFMSRVGSHGTSLLTVCYTSRRTCIVSRRDLSSRVRNPPCPCDLLTHPTRVMHNPGEPNIGRQKRSTGKRNETAMPQRRKKTVPVPKTRVTADRLKAALTKRKKSELIDVIAGFASADRGILRQLESRFGVETPPEELIDATRVAIADATDFDERQINYNFDYDYEAYSTVNRNFSRLIELGHLREAMELSQELMSQGSYQVEMSDEGMMTDDIEECLLVVINAIAKSDLPAADVTAWCAEMNRRDRVGFICDQELTALAKKIKR